MSLALVMNNYTETYTTKEVQLGQFPNRTNKDRERMVFFNQTFGEPKVISLDVNKVQKPQATRYFDYKTGEPIGIFLGRQIIDRKHIYVPESKNAVKNFVREGSTVDQTHCERLASFIYMNDYDHSEWPSVVFKLKTPLKIDGKTYFYELGSGGHHRETSLDILGAESWMYDIYEEMDSQSYILDDAIIQDNGKLQTPQLDLTRYALENKIVEMVTSGRWDTIINDEEKTDDDLMSEIKDYLKFCVPNIHPNTRSAIARTAVRKTESTDWVNYTPTEAENFIDNTNYVHSGNKDGERNQYGWILTDGYFDKKFFQAFMKFEETGLESYAVAYGKIPKNKGDGSKTIRDIKTEQFDKIAKRVENGLDKILEFKKEHGRYPQLAVNAIIDYLPQDRKTEDLSETTVVQEKKKKEKKKK